MEIQENPEDILMVKQSTYLSMIKPGKSMEVTYGCGYKRTSLFCC